MVTLQYLELRALTHQCVRLGTFFFLIAEDQEGNTLGSGRDEYHLSMEFEPGERMAAMGRVCVVQFDAGCLGRTDHGVLPAMPLARPVNRLRIRTNHVQTTHDLARLVYLWIQVDHSGFALRLDERRATLTSPEAGQFVVEIRNRTD